MLSLSIKRLFYPHCPHVYPLFSDDNDEIPAVFVFERYFKKIFACYPQDEIVAYPSGCPHELVFRLKSVLALLYVNVSEMLQFANKKPAMMAGRLSY